MFTMSAADGEPTPRVADGVDGLVGHHRCVHPFGDPGQPVEVTGGDRLLDERDADIRVLQGGDHSDRLARRPALVGVQAELDLGSDRLSGRSDAGHVCRRVSSHLPLQHREPLAGACGGRLGHGVELAGCQCDVGSDAVSGGSQEDGQAEAPSTCRQVVEGDVDRRLRRVVPRHCRGDRPAQWNEVVGVRSDQHRLERAGHARPRSGE
jgi:hypothetical protein